MVGIEEIAVNEKYKNFCKKITGYDDVLWKDLHQELMISIIKNNTIHTIPEEKVDVHIYSIANNLYRRFHNTRQLEKNPYYLLKNNSHNLKDYFDSKEVLKPTPEEVDLKAKLVAELKRLMTSENVSVRTGAEYLMMYINGKNRLKISKELGINYRIVHEAMEETITRIRAKITNKKYMTKTEIYITLRGEGVKASYSGKTKTFYVDKIPAVGIVKEVEEAGFKITKK